MKAKLTLLNEITYLSICKAFVGSLLNLVNFNNDMKKKISLVAEEAFCHIVNTAYEQGEVGEIKIEIDTDRKFTISFFDYGIPFDPSLIEEYNPENVNLNQFNSESLGIFLINEIADEVKWINLGRKGKELKIIFNYPEKDITETLSKKDLTLFTGKEAKVKCRYYDIHRIKENEYIQVARCIYKTYGYTYPNDDLYFPERIKEHNKNGTLISVVATDDKNNVVGHYALERYNMGVVAESGQAVIIPEHRGNNILEKMRAFLEEEAIKLKLHGIYSHPVTNHTLSQKVNIKYNSKPFGLILGFVPKTLHFKKVKTKIFEQRVSCLYYYKTLIEPKRKNYYIPEYYMEIVKEILDNAGFPKNKLIVGSKIPNKEGVIESSFTPGWLFGFIRVKEIGKNILNLIKQSFYELTMKASAETVYLELPVEHEGCEELIILAKELGFVFGGIAPSSLNGEDIFKMQYINCDLDLSALQIEGKTANKICDFIKDEFGA